MGLARIGFLVFISIGSLLAPSVVRADIVGLWQLDGDFENDASPLPSLVPFDADLGTWSAAFLSDMIDGQPATVLQIPAMAANQSLMMQNTLGANGGGSFLNNWSLVMDVRFPTIGGTTSLLQTNTANTNNTDLAIQPVIDGLGTHYRLGVPSALDGGGDITTFDGEMVPDSWHRVAVTMSSDGNRLTMRRYLDGQFIGGADTGQVSFNVDGRYGLEDVVHLFADNNGETTAGYVNAVAFYDAPLSPAAVAAMGGPSASMPIAPNLPPPAFPVPYAYYPFDEVNGVGTLTTPDRSGNRRDAGTLVSMSGASLVPGKVGNALEFPGGTSFVELADVDFDRPYPEFTLAAWIKPADVTPSRARFIAGKMAGSSDRGWQLWIAGANEANPGRLMFSYFDARSGGVENEVMANAALVSDEWLHVAVVYKADNFLDIYINGVLDTHDISGVLSLLNGFNAPLQSIGNRGSSTSNRSWEGLLDEVYFFDTALSASQIARLVTVPEPGIHPWLAAALAAVTVRSARTTRLRNPVIQ